MKQKNSIIEWAMRNRQIVFLVTALMVVAGIYSLTVMPKQEQPEFIIRQGVVIGVYPGATALEVEEQLTKPLEQYLFTFPEVNRKKTHSKSKDGMTFIFVELADNVKDKSIVWSAVKHGINLFKSSLPTGVMAVIANDNFGDVSSLLITIESDDKTYRELDSYADALEARLRTIETVANTHRSGSQKEQITLYVDNDRLSAYGVGQKLLMANLFAQGFTTSSGSLDNDRIVAPVHIAESYRNEQEIAEQIIFSDPQGNTVRVKDIARVTREYPEPESYIRRNGKKCILLSVEVRHDANIIDFGREVGRVLDNFQGELPESVSLFRIVDQPEVVSKSINTFLRELMMAIIAVVLVTMLLLPFRVALVAASSIPITTAITLTALYALNIPLNMLTLASLIIVMGMIVDNSVVIVDSYIDRLDRGVPRWEASVSSATEYFKSIFSATLAISITFFPFLFTVTGTTYDFLHYFPWAVSITLGLSLLVATLVIPAMQYLLIRRGLSHPGERKKRKTILDYVQGGYERLLAVCFAHPLLTVGVAIASIAGGVLLFTTLPQRMMPLAERNQFAVEIYLPQGSPLSQTAATCDSVEAVLRSDPRVTAITAFIGESSPRFHMVYAPNMPSKAYGQFIVTTVSNRATEELLDEYADRYAFHFPEAYVRFKQLDFQAVDAPVEVRLIGDDMAELKKQGEKLVSYFNSLDKTMWVRTSFDGVQPCARIELDPVEAGRLGINKAFAAMGIAAGVTGSNIATLWEGDYAMPVRLQPAKNSPSERERGYGFGFDDISDVEISGMLGAAVPLRQVASVSPEWNDVQITHRNGRRTLSVLADLRRDAKPADVYPNLYRFMDETIAPTLPAGVEYEYGGEPELVAEIMTPMAKALLIAIVIIYLILIFHTGKVSRASLIMASSLLSLFGAAFGIWALGIDFSTTAMLGIVGLIGIIVRNGIIMFDYLEKLRAEQSISIREAAMEAGKRRMRPIFLTSAAASMGVLPMIISKSPLWSPLGTVIFFGTMISMVLVVTVLPVAYTLIFKKEEKVVI
jgi:multidrug efflux pump subunit AcrB